MSDLSQLTDQQIEEMLRQQQQPAAPNPALAQMSDAELEAAIARTNKKAGPSGSLLTDIPRRLGTAAVDATMGWLSPILGRGGVAISPAGLEISPPTTEAQRQEQLQAGRSRLFNTMGGTEYVPETAAGRVGQSALTGLLMAGKPSAMIAGAGGGASAQLGAEAAQRVGVSPEIPALVAGLVGGAATQRLAQPAFGVRPGVVKPETAALAELARDKYGVPVTGLQMSETPLVRKFDAISSKFPFSPATRQLREQQDSFNRAASRVFGEDSPRITPELLDSARSRIGGVFEDFAKGETLKFTPDHGRALSDIVTNAAGAVTRGETAPIFKQIGNVVDKIGADQTMTGEQYLALTRKGAPLDAAIQSGNPNISNFAAKVRDVLDDVLVSSVSTDKAAGLKEARAQYKALKTIEPLTLRATDAESVAKPVEGDISPAALRARVNQQYQRSAFDEPGKNPLNDLANIGQRFLKDPRDSGTPLGSMVMNPIGGSWGAMAQRLTVPMIDQTLGRVMRSNMYADRLINGGKGPPTVLLQQPHLLVRALMAEEAANSAARSANNRQ